MKFGVLIIPSGTTWEKIRTSIETMEAGRWNSLWFTDHFVFSVPRSKATPEEEQLTIFEGFTTVAVAAGMTKRLKLGHLVLGNPYRNPALVAKMATTLDQTSKGRYTLGLGAGWFQREHEAYGWVFPTMKERQARLQEACELIRKLFTADGPVDYNGQYYQLDQAPLSPGSYQKPHIPILVGGTGERRTLRTLAMYGDIFNLDGWAGQGMTFELYQHKIGVLERHCENVGRDPKEIKHTLLIPLHVTDDKASQEEFHQLRGAGSMTGPLNEIIDRIGKFVEAGVDEIMFGNIPTGDVEAFQRVEEEIVAAF